jgi:hypothetical protein
VKRSEHFEIGCTVSSWHSPRIRHHTRQDSPSTTRTATLAASGYIFGRRGVECNTLPPTKKTSRPFPAGLMSPPTTTHPLHLIVISGRVFLSAYFDADRSPVVSCRCAAYSRWQDFGGSTRDSTPFFQVLSAEHACGVDLCPGWQSKCRHRESSSISLYHLVRPLL